MSCHRDTPPDVLAGIHKRRWRLFVVANGLLLAGFVVGHRHFWGPRPVVPWKSMFFAAVFLWFIVSIPACILYLLGRPLVLTFDLAHVSLASRRQWAALKRRLPLSDDEFYESFYLGSEISKEVLIRLRRSLNSAYPRINRVVPTDIIPLLDEEIDFDDVIDVIEGDFGIKFGPSDPEKFDGTFDSLAHLLQARLKEKPLRGDFAELFP
jgi:hypothetical protein